jgi:light-harvesting complex I chlorophyll a/b binding protein 1
LPDPLLTATIMAKLRALLVFAVVAAVASSFTGGARAAPKKAAPKVAKKAPVKRAAPKKAVAKKVPTKKGGFSPATDVGVTPPLGLFDPLGFLSRGPEVYRRYQEIEIKHGRIAMAATLGIIVTKAGIRFPGYLSISQDITFESVPGDLAGAYFGIPLVGWVQIMALIAALDIAVFRQDPAYPAGDVVQDLPIDWVRYDDPEVKTFKLNAERNNGRAAMFGIIGMISHAALGEDAIFPGPLAGLDILN